MPPACCVTIALVDGRNDQGGMGFRNYDGIGVEVLIAGEGRWATPDVIAAFEYPFGQLKVRRLWAVVDASNTTCQRFLPKLRVCSRRCLEKPQTTATATYTHF